jgi:hypothetical protein
MRPLVSFSEAALCALAFSAGTMLGASAATAVGAALPALPEGAEAGSVALLGLLASFALALALGPLAAGLAVGFAARWTILALLAYVCLGVNTTIEAAIFTTVGGSGGMLVLNAFSCSALAAALAVLFRPAAGPTAFRLCWQRFWRRYGTAQWAWRLAIAVLAFPAIYLAFGMMVGPLVIDAYRAGRFGLVLPGLDLILRVQALRSLLFLAASLPVLVAWDASRLRLWLALGAAHFALVGLTGLLQAYWLPATMRLAHGAEILCDSLAYAGVLVVLLTWPRHPNRAPAATPVAA